MPADYHTHTPLCHHAEGSPSEYVEAAIAAGLEEYGITCLLYTSDAADE